MVIWHYKWVKMDGKMGTTINISTLQITDEILKVIAEIDEFKGVWKAIGRIAPDRLINLRRPVYKNFERSISHCKIKESSNKSM